MSANTAVKDLGVRVGKCTCRAAVDAKVLLWLFIFITHFKRMNVETITRNDLKVEKTKYVTLKISCGTEWTWVEKMLLCLVYQQQMRRNVHHMSEYLMLSTYFAHCICT